MKTRKPEIGKDDIAGGLNTGLSLIQLGWRVRDTVSEITGIAVARIEYLNGCIQYCVVPPYTPGALEVSSFYIDEPQLEKVDDGVLIGKKEPVDGRRRQSFGANIKPKRYGAKP